MFHCEGLHRDLLPAHPGLPIRPPPSTSICLALLVLSRRAAASAAGWMEEHQPGIKELIPMINSHG